MLSNRALIILLDKARVRPEEWIAQNLGPPKPKGSPPKNKKSRR
jgi:hypothetical protein